MKVIWKINCSELRDPRSSAPNATPTELERENTLCEWLGRNRCVPVGISVNKLALETPVLVRGAGVLAGSSGSRRKDSFRRQYSAILLNKERPSHHDQQM